MCWEGVGVGGDLGFVGPGPKLDLVSDDSPGVWKAGGLSGVEKIMDEWDAVGEVGEVGTPRDEKSVSEILLSKSLEPRPKFKKTTCVTWQIRGKSDVPCQLPFVSCGEEQSLKEQFLSYGMPYIESNFNSLDMTLVL